LKSEAITFGSALVGTVLNQSINGPLYDLQQNNSTTRANYPQQAQGVERQMNNFGNYTTPLASDAITGSPPVLETGMSQNRLAQSASILSTIKGNVNPSSLSTTKTRSISN